jgi:ppGpp synthetase/RelA/SpoT-type nucleotidyltranferase
MTEWQLECSLGTEAERLAFVEEYNKRRSQYDRVLTQLLALLEEYRRIKEHDPKLRVHSVRGRVKTSRSLAQKALRMETIRSLNPSKVFSKITDLVGVRIVCNTLEGKSEACRWLENLEGLFSIVEARNVEYRTGYRSKHYLIQLAPAAWPTLRLDLSDDDESVTVEVQVRTILEEAWGEIEHDLVYKTRSSLSL